MENGWYVASPMGPDTGLEYALSVYDGVAVLAIRPGSSLSLCRHPAQTDQDHR